MLMPAQYKDAVHLEVCEPCRVKIFDRKLAARARLPATMPLPTDLCADCEAKVAQAVRILLSGHVMVRKDPS